MTERSDAIEFSESRNRDEDGNEVVTRRAKIRETEAGFPARPTDHGDITVHWIGRGSTPPDAQDGDLVEYVDENGTPHSFIVGA